MDDASLIGGILDGDEDAERTLYDRNVDRVYRLAFRMCGDEEMARELTQRTFIRVFDRIDQFAGRSALSSWIHRVATSVILNGLRSRSRQARRSAPLEMAEGERASSALPDPRLRERLHAAIDDLSDQRRTVFLMHDVEGYTHAEIGEALGIAAGTSKAHLHRARVELRTALADYAKEYA